MQIKSSNTSDNYVEKLILFEVVFFENSFSNEQLNLYRRLTNSGKDLTIEEKLICVLIFSYEKVDTIANKLSISCRVVRAKIFSAGAKLGYKSVSKFLIDLLRSDLRLKK